MFRQLAKLAQSARISDPHDPATSAGAGDRIRAKTIQTKPSFSLPAPGRLRQIDLNLSFNLLSQAIKHFSDLKPKTGQVLVDTRLLEQLRDRIIAYESERLQLRSDLEYAQHCAHSYWDRCKSIEDELDQLKGGALINSASKASSKRGVS
ncbi:MAG: hypothetical protein WCF20_13160 [Methylovirgula sp.]